MLGGGTDGYTGLCAGEGSGRLQHPQWKKVQCHTVQIADVEMGQGQSSTKGLFPALPNGSRGFI